MGATGHWHRDRGRAYSCTIGSMLWIYEARNVVGSKEDALAVAKTVAFTTGIP